jgi:S1-C subfamily serine protease
MQARCHKCGHGYLTARALAGQQVSCARCGALNDGAGAPAPATARRDDAPSGARHGARGVLSGASFTVGEKPRAIDPRVVDRAMDVAVGAKVAAEVARQREADGGNARVIRALGLVGITVALAIVGGLLLVRYLSMKPRGIDWALYQRAVPQMVTGLGKGTGFVIEQDRRLWLVTNYHVIEGATQVDAIFRNPTDGSILFPLNGIPTQEFRVHPDFLSVKETAADERDFDLAAVNIEMYRPQLEMLGIEPLEIASSSELEVGARVVAIGHVSSRAFALAADGDREAAGIATHSLFDGVLSAIRRTTGKPTLVQTSANYGSGCSGGPVMLEQTEQVAAVSTWGELHGDGTERAGLKFALAADQIFEVIRSGPTLRSVRDSIKAAASEPLPAPGVVDEAKAWATFPPLATLLRRCETEGWRLTGRAIMVTDASGRSGHLHRVIGAGGVEVAVLALPRDRSIDLDVPEITGQQFQGLGGDLSSVSGTTVAVQIKVPGTDVGAVLQQGFEISIAVQTLFLGEPVAARYMILVLERPASAGGAVPGGTSPTAGVGASSPLQPPSVPPSASTTPPAPPTSPPPATPPVTPP